MTLLALVAIGWLAIAVTVGVAWVLAGARLARTPPSTGAERSVVTVDPGQSGDEAARNAQP